MRYMKLLSLILLFIFCLLFNNIDAQNNITKKNMELDSIFNYICELQIKHPEIVIKQAIYETGWLKSEFLMSRNNLFGFRAKKYLEFPNWKASVDYYKKWQDKNYKNEKEDYYSFLVRIKYGTKHYSLHLKKLNYIRYCN